MKTILNIKVDKDIKNKTFEVAKDMGVPLSTLVNAFLKKLIRERSVTLVAPIRPSRALEKTLEQAEKDLKNSKNLSPVFTDTDSLMKYLVN